MPKKTLSVAEAKATFSEQIRDVERGEPVLGTRHGKPVAALVRPEDLETLERLRSAGPQSGLVRVAGGWEGSDELVSLLETSLRTYQGNVKTLDGEA